MPDFWRDSGFHLLKRRENGHLEVTDDFLRAYFLRPEVAPVEESCPAERALHVVVSAAVPIRGTTNFLRLRPSIKTS